MSAAFEPLTPEAVTKAFRTMAQIRREAAKEIEQLIGLLDRLDAPDEDLEDVDRDGPETDFEPSLGSVDNFANQERWARLHGQWDFDLEGEHDGREPNVDDEDAGDFEESGVGV